jgi:hypothetical protein
MHELRSVQKYEPIKEVMRPCFVGARMYIFLLNKHIGLHLSLCYGKSWRVFENRVLRRLFGPKRDEVTGDWRKLVLLAIHN